MAIVQWEGLVVGRRSNGDEGAELGLGGLFPFRIQVSVGHLNPARVGCPFTGTGISKSLQ